MKKKILVVTSTVFVVSLVIATVFFFLMKNADSSNSKSDSKAYDVSKIVEKINFLKLNSFDEIKAYADDHPIYIQTSEDETLFAIGELYVEEFPVKIFYKLNEDGSINRFDGKYSYKLHKSSKDEVWETIQYFNRIIVDYFACEYFDHSIYDEKGAPIDPYDEESYKLMLNGKAKYNLSIVDENNTYWNISAVVTDKKQIEFEFFRCFDLSVYNDDSPNIDLRMLDETGE